jgi:hypothetical protein
MLSEIAPLLNELKRSRFYRGIVWAGGYPGFTPTPFSDIDLYAITASDHHHWVAERFGDRRVELTFFSRPKWETVLKHDALHPKHHFTFMHGEIIHDPEGLCEEVREIAFKTRWRFKATDDQIEHLRYILSIGKDKQRGFLSRGQMGHAHMAAVGNLFNSTELLCRFWEGYSLTGGHNINLVLAHPRSTATVRESIRLLTESFEPKEMARHAIALIDETLALTGGDILSFRGGIPR